MARYNAIIKPMLKNEKLVYNASSSDHIWKEYEYENGLVHYLVAAPRFLKFTGNLSVLTATDYNEDWIPINDYSYSCRYNPELFGDNKIFFSIYDYTAKEKIGGITRVYDIDTDSNLNLVYESEPGLYDAFIDDIRVFFEEDVKSFFGEEVFR